MPFTLKRIHVKEEEIFKLMAKRHPHMTNKWHPKLMTQTLQGTSTGPMEHPQTKRRSHRNHRNINSCHETREK